MLEYLTIALFALWLIVEETINVISAVNRSRGTHGRKDRFSFLVVWLSIVLTIFLAVLTRLHPNPLSGFGELTALFPAMGYLGCLLVMGGISIRVVAVLTLRKQFTTTVSIVKKHEIVSTGIYAAIRHPAYLGTLMSLLGFGFASGNCLVLGASLILPPAAMLYRIRVEEKALIEHFGAAYREYAGRTKRLLPGIY